jgi:hypothetical protein
MAPFANRGAHSGSGSTKHSRGTARGRGRSAVASFHRLQGARGDSEYFRTPVAHTTVVSVKAHTSACACTLRGLARRLRASTGERRGIYRKILIDAYAHYAAFILPRAKRYLKQHSLMSLALIPAWRAEVDLVLAQAADGSLDLLRLCDVTSTAFFPAGVRAEVRAAIAPFLWKLPFINFPNFILRASGFSF